jgi:hypothetical protein
MSQGFSVTCRFAFTGTIGSWERIFDFNTVYNNNSVLLSRNSGTNKIRMFMFIGTTAQSVTSSIDLSQSTIYNVTCIFNAINSTLQMYINGILQNTTSSVISPGLQTYNYCYVGSSTLLEYLNGDIYSLNIYNRLLTPNELNGPPAPIPRGIFTATPNGLTSDQAATNAFALRQGYPGYGDGVYWINCGGVPKQTYCLMDPKWDGGGWMLIMKAAQGSTFNWGSTHWTTTSTLNPTDTTTTVADAKFDVFNSVPVNDVMAVWPASDVGAGNTGGSLSVSDGWVWLVKNWYTSAITPLAGFQIDRPAIPPDIFNFSGFSKTSPIWSYQSGTRAHVFGSGAHVTGPDTYITRWGYLWNNEVNTTSTQDAFAGIGLNNPSSSGGDFYFWVGTEKKGFNRNIAWLMYGR